MMRAFFLASICLMLAACGGQDANLIIPKPEISDIRLVRHDLLEEKLRDAARAGPNFRTNREQDAGRIEHASQHDIFSEDFADRWSDVRMTIQREDGEKIELDSTRHSITEPLDSAAEPDRGPLLDYGLSGNHERRDWTLFRATKTGASVAYSEVNWDDDDPTNYLAGGYWMHLDRIDLDWSPAPWAFDDADAGAFIRGPEFAGNPTLPGRGTATYLGRATGLYTFFYGPTWANLQLARTKESGIYHGVAQLTADFSKNEIRGCIGCLVPGEDTSWRLLDFGGSIQLPVGAKAELYALYHNYNTPLPAGFDLASYSQEDFESGEIDVRESQYRIHLAPAPINGDGSFRGDRHSSGTGLFPRRSHDRRVLGGQSVRYQ